MEYQIHFHRDVLLHYVSYEYYSALNLPSPHLHSFPTITFVDKLVGECEYQIGKKHVCVQEGDILLINPGVYHSKQLKAGAEIHEVHLAFENVQIEGLPTNRIVLQEDFHLLKINDSERQLFREAVNILNWEADFDRPYGDLVALSLFYQFLTVVLRSATSGARDHRAAQPLAYSSSNHDNIVNSLREYLIENYTKNITLSVVAKRMYLSTEYLSRLFKAEVGKSPYTFLIELRINKARELLETTSDTIHSVALQVGYSDAYHFSKQFKKVTAMSPSEYRKAYKNTQIPGNAK